MYFSISYTVLTVFLLLACTHHDNSAVLLSTPAKSARPIVGEELQYYEDKLKNYKDRMNIIFAIFHLWEEQYPQAQSIISSIEKHERADSILHKATLIFDNVPDDDSIGRYRYDMQIQNKSDTLSIIRLEESWRCWPDRGHQSFSTEPCK